MDEKARSGDTLKTRQYHRPRRWWRLAAVVIILLFSWHHVQFFQLRFSKTTSNDQIEWQDNMFPYRNQTPWDISTGFDYPRTIEYDVEEGTWLRLDVHPESGDIVFDMVGDIYCMRGGEVFSEEEESQQRIHARPVLRGVPYDADPRFSPDGDKLMFRSDAGLGVENAWVMPWKGCEEHDLDAHLILQHTNRLVREGRSQGVYADANRDFFVTQGYLPQRCLSRMKLFDTSQTLVSIPVAIKLSRQNGLSLP